MVELKMRPARSAYHVFLSHSSADTWIASVMSEKIEEIGGTTWLDEKDLEGGAVILASIIKAIDESNEVLVVVSPLSVKSQWVMAEIGAGLGQHKRVTPVLNNVKVDALRPLGDIKAIELNTFDVFLSQLRRRIMKKRSGES